MGVITGVVFSAISITLSIIIIVYICCSRYDYILSINRIIIIIISK